MSKNNIVFNKLDIKVKEINGLLLTLTSLTSKDYALSVFENEGIKGLKNEIDKRQSQIVS